MEYTRNESAAEDIRNVIASIGEVDDVNVFFMVVVVVLMLVVLMLVVLMLVVLMLVVVAVSFVFSFQVINGMNSMESMESISLLLH